MNKKICLLVDGLIGGGAEKVILSLAEIFSKLGHEVHIISIKNVIEHEIDKTLYTIHMLSKDGILSKKKFINKIKLAKKLKAKIFEIEQDSNKFDMFISNSENMDRLSTKLKLNNLFIQYGNSMYEFYKSKFQNKKGIKREWRKFKYGRFFRKIYSNQNIIVVSKALQSDLVDKMKIKPKMIKTIYNPLNFDKIKNLAKQNNQNIPKEPYIICVAKYENRKDQLTLIKAYHKTNIKQKLLLMGGVYTQSDKDYLEKIQQLIIKLDIKEKVILMNFQKNPYPFIKNASLLVLSSKSEGFGLVLAEALILGTKIISTNCPCGPNEILRNELQEYLSPVGNTALLAQNIKKAINSYPVISNSLIEEYSAEYSAKQYLGLIENDN